MFEIKKVTFCNNNPLNIPLANNKYNKDPIVYILRNKGHYYVGETSDIKKRLYNHYTKHKNNGCLYSEIFEEVFIISHPKFDKSFIQDIEQLLILFLNAEDNIVLYNSNMGCMFDRNYYKRDIYRELFNELWEKLINEGIVKKSIIQIEVESLLGISSNVIKEFSHYDLNLKILKFFYNNFINNNPKKIIIESSPGCGKTTLSIYILITLLGLIDNNLILTFINKPTFHDNILDVLRIYRNHLEYEYKIENGKKIKKINFNNRKNIMALKNLKIAYICPYRMMKVQLINVFNKFNGLLNNIQIFTTNEYIEEFQKNQVKFDLLFIDDVHHFKKYNKIIKNEKKSLSEFEFILETSTIQIMLYDIHQTMSGSITQQDVFKGDKIKLSLRNAVYDKINDQLN